LNAWFTVHIWPKKLLSQLHFPSLNAQSQILIIWSSFSDAVVAFAIFSTSCQVVHFSLAPTSSCILLSPSQSPNLLDFRTSEIRLVGCSLRIRTGHTKSARRSRHSQGKWQGSRLKTFWGKNLHTLAVSLQNLAEKFGSAGVI
jgi:hypothetical protein